MSVASSGRLKSADDRNVVAYRYGTIAGPPSSTTTMTTASTMSGIGHNHPPSFDNIVAENLRRGLLLSQLHTILRAVSDPHLSGRHLQVLAQIIERTNAKSGMAYPGRARLAADITYYSHGEPKHYSVPSIANAVSDLIYWGYIVSDKRAAEGKGRALSHYATTPPSIEALRAQITAWCESIRQQPKREFPASRSADVDTSIDVRDDDDTSDHPEWRKLRPAHSV